MWFFLFFIPPPNASRDGIARHGRREKRTRQPPPIVGFVIFSGPRASFSSRSTVTPAGRTELKRTSQLRPSHRRRAGFLFRASWRPRPKGPPAGPLALHIRSDAFSVRLSYYGLRLGWCRDRQDRPPSLALPTPKYSIHPLHMQHPATNKPMLATMLVVCKGCASCITIR